MKTRKTSLLLPVILLVISALGCSNKRTPEIATVSVPTAPACAQQNDANQLSSTDAETDLCAHGHDWNCWRTVRKATMEEEGLAKRKCFTCGVSQECALEKIPSTHNHIYVCSITIEPTCTSAGLLVYVCDCGCSITEEIPISEHIQYAHAACTCDGNYTAA